MTINLSLGAAIFLLGTATGTLLKRLQWTAFKQKVSQDLREQMWAARSVECGPTESDDPNTTNVMATSGDDPHPATPAPFVEEAMSLDMIADPSLRTLLDQKQTEAARLLREIQALRSAIPLLEDDPDSIEQGDRSDQRPTLQIRYELRSTPRRAR